MEADVFFFFNVCFHYSLSVSFQARPLFTHLNLVGRHGVTVLLRIALVSQGRRRSAEET